MVRRHTTGIPQYHQYFEVLWYGYAIARPCPPPRWNPLPQSHHVMRWYWVSSGGTVSLHHASMAPPTEQCTHRTMLLPVYRGAHVHGIGLPNTREWLSTRLACGILGCSTRHPTRSTSGMTMPWSALGHPASGIVLPMHNGLSPCALGVCLHAVSLQLLRDPSLLE